MPAVPLSPVLDTRHREVQRELADCNRLHARIMAALPSARRRACTRALRRALPDRAAGRPGTCAAAGAIQLPAGLVGTAARLPRTANDDRDNPAVRSIENEISRNLAGMRLRFRLRANPTKRISERSTEQEPRWHGKRIELRRKPNQLAWLERKAGEGGFRLLGVQLAGAPVLDVRVP